MAGNAIMNKLNFVLGLLLSTSALAQDAIPAGAANEIAQPRRLRIDRKSVV